MKSKAKTLMLAAAVMMGIGVAPCMAAPIAIISGPYTILPGQTITLSGAASYDTTPNASLSFAWDLNNDGVFNDSAAVAPSFTVGSAALIGSNYVVALQVTDSFGAHAVTASTVTVVKELPPAVVPEPVSLALFGVGALGLSAIRRKRSVN